MAIHSVQNHPQVSICGLLSPSVLFTSLNRPRTASTIVFVSRRPGYCTLHCKLIRLLVVIRIVDGCLTSQDLLELHAGEKMTQEERIKLSAARVGFGVPETYEAGLGGSEDGFREALTTETSRGAGT